jgi:hypothetical protein
MKPFGEVYMLGEAVRNRGEVQGKGWKKGD